ncbi:hypothetical protein DIURU_005695 [Diutina rugosa]|uniref:Alternative oxidase n=1 Tax=Diutina rugosa TaxID=5481 RepID=A0A642UCE6_DIURU|nr:uncharacterized protein DIURU_005695 [Diutina rugosa]KAA8896683.1 hypothetical protein DIURU_005695 [Diutina rugosa]
MMLTRTILPNSSRVFARYATTIASNPHTPQIKNKSAGGLGISTKVYTNDEVAQHDDNKFISHAMFPHPKWTDEDCALVQVEHREPQTLSDRFAYSAIQFVRKSFDFVTGYKKSDNLDDTFKGTRYEMTEAKWLTRVIFLESIAGVPGMCAGFIRHLHSLRLLKRDKAWIETLLDEAYNERMHLLTFIKLGQPSWFTRSIIYVAQGIFTNVFFLAYLVRPKVCHRLVGYLEEEAVATYTHLLHQLKKGELKQFDHVQVPKIATQYWSELNENSTFYDLVARIRADEAKHREVNHTLANLSQKSDRNPFALQVTPGKPEPNNGLKVTRGTGWEKDEMTL